MIQPGFQFEHHAERKRVIVTLSATATVDVWWTTVSVIVSQNVWDVPLIYDMRSVNPAPLLLNLPNLVRVVEDLTRRHGRRGPVAALVQPEDVTIWRQRTASLFQQLLTVEVFSELGPAEEWLERQSDESNEIASHDTPRH